MTAEVVDRYHRGDTGPIDFLDPAMWRDQPRDEYGQWIKADARARRRQVLAALDAGEHVTVFDLPPDPDIVRESLFGGAVIVYRPTESTTITVTPPRRHQR